MLSFFANDLLCVYYTLIISVLWWYAWFRRRKTPLVVGFFHPNCADFGGGERVLWHAVAAVRELAVARGVNVSVLVYTAASAPADGVILQQTAVRFGIQVSEVRFVRIRSHWLLDPARYPRLTLALQSLAGALVCLECMARERPDVFIDTVGCALAFPVARLFLVRSVVAYVHYPTVSTDMLAVVRDRRPTFNNSGTVARSPLLSAAKLAYYRWFALVYGWCGRLPDVVMVNSSWTQQHIRQIWNRDDRVRVVYPPCDVAEFAKLPLAGMREPIVVSVGQFRPEKNHALQIRAFSKWVHGGSGGDRKRDGGGTVTGPKSLSASLRDRYLGSNVRDHYRLVCIGGCRSKDDERRVRELRDLAHDLGVSNRVDFLCNVSFSYILSWLSRASVGLHTMRDEHFGIGVVELMASGVATIAHDSGGPKTDIILPGLTGFLASTEAQFVAALDRAAHLTAADRFALCSQARLSSFRFSAVHFSKDFQDACTGSIEQMQTNCVGCGASFLAVDAQLACDACVMHFPETPPTGSHSSGGRYRRSTQPSTHRSSATSSGSRPPTSASRPTSAVSSSSSMSLSGRSSAAPSPPSHRHHHHRRRRQHQRDHGFAGDDFLGPGFLEGSGPVCTRCLRNPASYGRLWCSTCVSNYRGTLSARLRAYPPGPQQQDLEYGNRVLFPPSLLEEIVEAEIDLPQLFSLQPARMDRRVICGVREFTAPPHTCIVPAWLLKKLRTSGSIEDGVPVSISIAKLPAATFIRLQPHSVDFQESIIDARASLETALSRCYVSLTTGAVIEIMISCRPFAFSVLAVEPSSNDPSLCEAVALLPGSNVAVDLAAPKDEESRGRKRLRTAAEAGTTDSTSNKVYEFGAGENVSFDVVVDRSAPVLFQLSVISGYPDLFISQIVQRPTELEHSWRTVKFGSDQIYISASDPYRNLDSGLFYICVREHEKGPASFTVEIIEGNQALSKAQELGLVMSDARIPDAAAAADVVAGSEECPVCFRVVPRAHFERHSAFCSRNNVGCLVCRAAVRIGENHIVKPVVCLRIRKRMCTVQSAPTSSC